MATDPSVLGKVHAAGDGRGVVCLLELTGDAVLAVERRPEEGQSPRHFEFPLRSCRIEFGGSDHDKLVLRTGDGEAGLTLYVERAEFEGRLQRCGIASVTRSLQAARAADSGRKRVALAIFAGVLVGLLGCGWLAVRAADWGVDRALDLVPPAWEVTLGDGIAEAFMGERKEVTDPVVLGAVETITGRLTAALGEVPYPLRFHVVEDEAVNAFALPGGNMVVLTGLLSEARSPEEVAGVLAHEIQHVLRRHSLRNILHHLKWRLLLTMVIGDLQTFGEIALAKATGLIELGFNRDMEREADIRGVELLVRANLDPRGLRSFFDRLATRQGALVEKLSIVSTHPASSERVQYLGELIDRTRSREFSALDVDWAAVQARLEKGSPQ